MAVPILKQLQTWLLPGILSCFLLLGVAGQAYAFALSQKATQPTLPEPENIGSNFHLTVDVQGAVKNPGVYNLPVGQRLTDAISKADGFSDDADTTYIAKELNLATALTDGQKIYVFHDGERDSNTSHSIIENDNNGSGQTSNNISINDATVSELMQLKGIGESRAEDIVANRPYSQLTELTTKDVLTQNLFEQIEVEISL